MLLSASIGKELLEKNTKLEDKLIELQAEVQNTHENLEQLNYQLAQKNDLITKLTRDDECGSQNGKNVRKKFCKNIILCQRHDDNTIERCKLSLFLHALASFSHISSSLLFHETQNKSNTLARQPHQRHRDR